MSHIPAFKNSVNNSNVTELYYKRLFYTTCARTKAGCILKERLGVCNDKSCQAGLYVVAQVLPAAFLSDMQSKKSFTLKHILKPLK